MGLYFSTKTTTLGLGIRLKSAHAAQDIAGVDGALEALNSAWQAASQEIYQAQQQSQGAADNNQYQGQQQGSSSADDGVQDVDFEEVK